MELDIKKAFLSPFSDTEWYINLIFPFAISLFSSFANSDFSNFPKEYNHLISTVLLLLLAGFYAQFQHNEIHNIKPLLPTINSKYIKYLRYGFMSSIVTSLYVIANVVLLGVLKGILSRIFLLFHLSHIAIIAKIIIAIFFITAAIFSFFVILSLFIAWMFELCAYADCLKINRNMNLFHLLKMMSSVKSEILVYILILAIILSPFLGYANTQFQSINLLIFIAPIILIYAQLVGFNLAAQMYRVAKGKLKNTEIITQGA